MKVNKLMVSVALLLGMSGMAKAAADDITAPIITNVFTTYVSVSSSSLPSVRIGVQSAKPSIVLNKAGYAPVVMTNNAGSLSVSAPIAMSGAQSVTGTVSVSTASTSTQSVSLAGAVDALPTTGFSKNTLVVLTSDNALYISTEAVAGTFSSVKVGAQ